MLEIAHIPEIKTTLIGAAGAIVIIIMEIRVIKAAIVIEAEATTVIEGIIVRMRMRPVI